MIWGLGHYLYAVASGLFQRVLNVFTISMGLIDKQAQTRYDSEGVQPLEVVIQVRYSCIVLAKRSDYELH